MAIETAPEREQRTALRGVMFFVALIAIPAGLYGVIGQHAVGAAVAVLAGLGCLLVWWLTRRRFAGVQARRLSLLCSLLTITVAAGAVLGVVLFLASPSYGVSIATLMPAIIALAVTLAVLAARLVAGHRLKAVAASEIAAARAKQLAVTRTGPQMPGLQTDTRSIAEIADLRQRLQSGQYQSTPCLTVQPDGTLVLRPQRVRVRGWHRGSAAALPFAMILIAREFMTTGWTGLIAVAVSVAVILLIILSLYELRVRHGAAILTDTKLVIPTWYGRRRTVPRRLVARVALLQARQPRGSAVPLMLAIGSDGGCLLRLSGGSIPWEDVLTFAAGLQVPVDVRKEQQELGQLSQDYPGSVPWAWQHPAALGLLIALVIVLIVVGVVVGLAVAGVIQPSSGSAS